MAESTLPLILLALILGVGAKVSLSSVESCEPGSYFVEDYIKYQCYKHGDVKGAQIVGCQPSNDLTGVTLEAWETYNERWFKYHCVIDGNNAQYSVKSCLDPAGELLPVTKSRSFPDGESFTCFIEKNKVKLNHQTTSGCRVDEQVYGDRATWIEKKEDVISIGSQHKVIGQGVMFQCRKHINGSFVVETAACLTSENTYIRLGSFGTVSGEVVKCSDTEGKCQLRKAEITETGCSVGNSIYRHDEEWKSADGKTAYICQYGTVQKKGCLVQEILIPLNSIRYVNDEAVLCHQGTQLRSFGSLKGCTTSTGEIVPFEGRVKNGQKMESCGFTFDQTGAVQFKWTQVGCIYSKELITINAIQQFGEQYVHCALNGTDGYIVKLMSREEIEKWLTITKQQWSNIVLGNEGSGRNVKRETSTIPPSTTTTAAPIPSTTMATTTILQTITTTTPPTTTTTSPPTTTTTAPPTTTTTTPPTTTTTTPPTTTMLPLPTIAITTSPMVTPRSPPSSDQSCVDLIDDCKKMQIYCSSEKEHANSIKAVLQKSSLNSRKKSQILQFVDHVLLNNFENRKHSSMKTNECDAAVLQGPHCQCQGQKEFNRLIVQSLCPATCEKCGKKRRSISDIIETRTRSICQEIKCDCV